jgi:hypothetical protein
MKFYVFFVVSCFQAKVVEGFSRLVLRKQKILDEFSHLCAKLQPLPERTILMKLTRLSPTQAKSIIPTSVNNDQWISFWGVSKKERVQKILESFLISYGGGWMAW